jgi:hypothetical protein
MGERRMRQAAGTLKRLERTNALAIPVCFLTGPRFIHQTLFCAHSFQNAAGKEFPMEVFSDGRLGDADAAKLRQVFPHATIALGAELDARVADALPPGKFPALHAVRKSLALLRKLTDAMAGRRGYRLFFDSDMLFWRTPSESLTRAAAGEPLYMADTVADGYTATRADITRALGVPVAAGVNSGLVGLDAGSIDWIR